jgi:glycosyltransferase involved in cell wall biosynthesis
MKILMMTSMFPPIRTGSSFYAEDLASALKRKGHDIAVVTLKNNEASPDQQPFPVYRLPALHLENLFRKYFKHFRICSLYPGNYRRLNDLVKRHRPDVILLVSHYHDIGFLAAHACKKYKIPVVCTVNTQLQLNNPIMRTVLKTIDKLVLGTRVLPYCTKIISLDKEIERYLADTYRKRIVAKSVIIPYGSHGDLRLLSRGPIPEKRYGQLIGVGHLIEQRNYVFSVMIFAELLKNYPDLKFKIIGHVYYPAAVNLANKLGIEGSLIFSGELPHETILQEVLRSDLYMNVGSGRYLGLGTAALEAMEMGVPIVSNAPSDLLGDVRLADMQSYVYADEKDIQGVLEKMRTILESKDLREGIGKNGQRLVRENIDWESIATRMEELFFSLPKGI